MPNATSTGEAAPHEEHASTTDSEQRLTRRADGQPARLGYMAMYLMETSQRPGSGRRFHAGQAHRQSAEAVAVPMRGPASKGRSRIHAGADKSYDVGSS